MKIVKQVTKEYDFEFLYPFITINIGYNKHIDAEQGYVLQMGLALEFDGYNFDETLSVSHSDPHFEYDKELQPLKEFGEEVLIDKVFEKSSDAESDLRNVLSLKSQFMDKIQQNRWIMENFKVEEVIFSMQKYHSIEGER